MDEQMNLSHDQLRAASQQDEAADPATMTSMESRNTDAISNHPTDPVITTSSQDVVATEQMGDPTEMEMADIQLPNQQVFRASERYSDEAAGPNTQNFSQHAIKVTDNPDHDDSNTIHDKAVNEEDSDLRRDDTAIGSSPTKFEDEQKPMAGGMGPTFDLSSGGNDKNGSHDAFPRDEEMGEETISNNRESTPEAAQANSTIKQEVIDDDVVTYDKKDSHLAEAGEKPVKQEDQLAKSGVMNHGSSTDDLLSFMSHFNTGGTSLTQYADSLEQPHNNTDVQHPSFRDKVTSCDSVLKRKQPHGELNEAPCMSLASHPGIPNGDSSTLSKVDPMATYHIPKRQKVIASDQKLKEKTQRLQQTKSKEKSARGNSARQLNAQSNVEGTTTTLLNLLRGTNAIESLQSETGPEVAPKVKAIGWKAQFSRMLANCPETSNANVNRSQLSALEAAVKNFGRKIKAENGLWKLSGMKSGLLHHQVIGIDWMLGREEAADESRGGILADSMGLGKTVQTLATIISNTAKGKAKGERVPRNRRSTLIIASPSLLSQWASEIDKHTADRALRGVLIFDPKKDSRRITDNDIVLASYGDVSRSCPFPDKKHLSKLNDVNRESGKDFEATEDDSAAVESWIEKNMDDSGPLHQVDWHRVVIDEAHKIKNHQSRISYAVNALKGKHRWALSGTPIMNSYEELYPYFRFFREPDAKSFKMFRAKFCDVEKKPENMERLDKILARLLLSRTMQDKFMGRPLVDLPKIHVNDQKIEFSPVEKILYEAMEGKFMKKVEDILSSNENVDNDDKVWDQRKSNNGSELSTEEDATVNEDEETEKQDETLKDMLIGITRLRQMTAHPLLVEGDIQKIFEITELEEIHQKLLELNDPKNMICRRIGVLLEQKKRGYTEYGDERQDGDVCHKCYDLANEVRIIPLCKHRICIACIKEKADLDDGHGKLDPECPICGTAFDIATLKTAAQLKPKKKSIVARAKPEKKSGDKTKKGVDKDLDKSEKNPKKNSKVKAMDSLGVVPAHSPMPWLADFDAGIAELPPSTKLSGLESQIRDWMVAAPSDKIIIFTQWRNFTAIVGRVLERHKLGFVYFTKGDMSQKSRQDATSAFRSNPSIKVMVATLKTAGEGLNLEFANRVVSSDLWWNACVERQALARVLRIGQTKETHFARLIIANSVDDRILQMQIEKLEMVEKVMKPKLTRLEMAKLFGRTPKEKKNTNAKQTASSKKAEEEDSQDSNSEEMADDLSTESEDSDSDASYTS